jgi:hypothetical protein
MTDRNCNPLETNAPLTSPDSSTNGNQQSLSVDKTKTECDIPRHPFFESVDNQANFTECINAIDRVRSMIDLCSCLKLEEEHAGLTSDAAYGFYWITVLMQSTLTYVSKRLVILNMEKGEKYK